MRGSEGLMGCSGWALDRGMDGTEVPRRGAVGKTAEKFLEDRGGGGGGMDWGER